MQLFDPSEATNDLDALLRAGGFDPADPKVDGIKRITSRYFAKRTAEVLAHVNEVLAKYTAANDH